MIEISPLDHKKTLTTIDQTEPHIDDITAKLFIDLEATIESKGWDFKRR